MKEDVDGVRGGRVERCFAHAHPRRTVHRVERARSIATGAASAVAAAGRWELFGLPLRLGEVTVDVLAPKPDDEVSLQILVISPRGDVAMELSPLRPRY